jgi:cytochrome c oxidase cbb3-type subunit I/II
MAHRYFDNHCLGNFWLEHDWNNYGSRVQHIYAAIWWYLATFLVLPFCMWLIRWNSGFAYKKLSIYAGAQDAVVQWWYGHNAVAFFLTTPFLGLMYYYLPKAANRPIYSYKLSIIHFWSLIFLYMWAGPHHLLYQAFLSGHKRWALLSQLC